MDPEAVQLVRQSLGRCLLNNRLGKGFLDAFYDAFLASDPRIRPLFAATDMQKQKNLLKNGLAMLVMFASGQSMARQAVGQLGQTHDHEHLNIEPAMYRFWVESLLTCVRAYDPKADEGLIRAWTQVLEPGIEAMRRAY